MNGNLIPTQRPDKNGKVVTRHVKPRVSEVSKSLRHAVPRIGVKKREPSDNHVGSLEADAIKNPLARMAHKFSRDRSTSLLANRLLGHGREIHRYTNEAMFRNDIGYALTAKEVKEALALTVALTRNSVPDEVADKDRYAVVHSILRPTSDKDCGRRVSRLHAQLEWLKEHPGEALKVVAVSDALGYGESGDESPIENLDALVAVADHGFLQDEDCPQELKRAYILAVADNPAQADQIGDYVLARNGFDEEGFREYMRAGKPLAGGAL